MSPCSAGWVVGSCVAIAGAVALAGCRVDEDAVASAQAAGSPPSLLIDPFGPPRGQPIHATPTAAPAVPPPTRRDHPATVIVELEVREMTAEIAPGVRYRFWTYGGGVPGKLIRVRQGDVVEFHLQNHPDNRMPHSIDLHAVTGPGGGASSTFTAPGRETQFTFRAKNPGLYVYHCAAAPVAMHVANGLYGLIYVEPPQGLPPVDREYYVMQGDFYTAGERGDEGMQEFDLKKGIDEHPTYVVFNGAEGSLTGDHALTAKVGDRVRLFVGNGGPNLAANFHVIGEIFDVVYTEGGTRTQENVQTTVVPAGGSAIVEFTVDAPGTYVLVDHALFRAFHKGAVGMLKVEGPDATEVYSGKQRDVAYTPSPSPPPPPPDGRVLYAEICALCHGDDGKGEPHETPPLAKADFLAKRSHGEIIGVVLGGLTGKIQVNGHRYRGRMDPLGYLGDDEIAAVLTHVMTSWGNDLGEIRPAEVAAARARRAVTPP